MSTNKQTKIPTLNNTRKNYTYKVSIIVPCYNTKPWLDECLQSLVDQTLQDIEIICINDGSTDGTGARLDELQTQYPDKIKVIHQANGGLSNARNVGMKTAQGECIGFVDSDDFVDITIYEKLYKIIKDNNADVARCDHYTFIHNIPKLQDNYNRIIINENLLDILTESPAIWTGLYSSNFLQQNQIKFVPNLSYEDHGFKFKVAISLAKFAKTTQKLYFYRKQRPNQITFSFKNKRVYHVVQLMEYIESINIEHIDVNLRKIIKEYLVRKKLIFLIRGVIEVRNKHKTEYLLQMAKSIFNNNNLKCIYRSILMHNYKNKIHYLIALFFILLAHFFYIIQPNKSIK